MTTEENKKKTDEAINLIVIEKLGKWRCDNQINDEDGKMLFKEQQVYEEGDDRGEVEEGDIAICLFNELGYRTYLFNKQVIDNFTEL